MSRPRITDHPHIDLDLSMYPSFASALYAYTARQTWVKVLGLYRGLRLRSVGGRLVLEGAYSQKLARLVDGTWHYNATMTLRERAQGLLSRLLELYQGLVVVAAEERDLIALTVFLSRRTSYHSNVVRWVRYILADIDYREPCRLDTRTVAERARHLPSYQPRQLAAVIDQLVDAVCSTDNPTKMRRKLLEIQYVGPKTADAILLFTATTSRVAPADTHLNKLARSLGLRLAYPQKHQCLRAGECTACSMADHCLSGAIVKAYGDAAGLVQTIAYVHDTIHGDYTRLYRVLERYMKQK